MLEPQFQDNEQEIYSLGLQPTIITQPMRLIKLSTILASALFVMTAISMAADATGTWTWTQPARNGGGGGGGGAERKTTLKLKAEGEKLTGKMITPGRQGAEPRETEISNGKVSGDDISFEVTREFNGNKFTTKYSGKVTADSIKGKIETPGT